MQTYFLSILAYVLACACSGSAQAIQIKLKKPFIYRKESFQEFDTKDVALSALERMLRELDEEDPENAQLITTAIADGDFPHAANVVYFYPPLTYAGEQYYQYYIYGRSPKVRQVLTAMLDAIREAMPSLEDRNRALYEEALRRIELRLENLVRDENAATPKRSKKRTKKRDRAEAAQPEAPRAAPPHLPADVVFEADGLEIQELFQMPDPFVWDVQVDFSGLPDFLQ